MGTVSLSRSLLFAASNSRVLEQTAYAPLVNRLVYRVARRYVAGTRRSEVLASAERLVNEGFRVSLDLLGEGVTDRKAVLAATAEYRSLAAGLPVGTAYYLSVDLTLLGLDLSKRLCLEQLQQILATLPTGTRLQVSAKDAARTDRTLEVVGELATTGRLMMTVQANLRRSSDDAQRLTAAGVPIRLVKGAYVESPSLAYPWGAETDQAFRGLAQQLWAAKADFSLATHDPVMRRELLSAMPSVPLEMLFGVAISHAERLVQAGHPVRLYLPYGREWYKHWMRRLAESRGSR